VKKRKRKRKRQRERERERAKEKESEREKDLILGRKSNVVTMTLPVINIYDANASKHLNRSNNTNNEPHMEKN